MAALVAKIEKNLTDHTEFLNYKEEMDKWLAIANDTLDECAGIGNEAETRQKLTSVTVSTELKSLAECDLKHFLYFLARLEFIEPIV